MSARIHLNYYQTVFATSPQDLLLGLFIPSREGAFSGVTVHYSPAVILLIGFGLFLLSRLRQRRFLRPLAIGLGLVPLFGVAVGLCLLPAIAGAVPYVGSTNITRVLWFSDVFLMLAVGFALERLTALDLNRKQFVLGCLVLLAGMSPRFVVAAWQATGFRAEGRSITFQPPSFLQLMQPGTRLAADIDPVPDNFDIKAISHGMLATSGRSIVLNNQFRSALLSEGLIETATEGMSYYFTASPPERLARFGIRYFATRDSTERLQAQGWQRRAADAGFVLYESPLAVTPIYIDGREPEFVTSYTIGGNRVAVDLPPGRQHYTVVATFLATPGWKATIDDRAVPIRSGPDGMLAVSVDEGHRLGLEYEPYSDGYLFAVFGLSLLFVIGGAYYLVPGGAPGRASHPAQAT